MRFTKPMLTALLLLSGWSTQAQLTSGLVAHWTFNGSLTDVTSNGHNATVSMKNALPLPGYAVGMNGLANNSYNFKDDVVMEAPYQPDLNVHRFSICAVLYPNVITNAIILERTHNGPVYPWAGFYRASIVNPGTGSNFNLIGLSNFASTNTLNNVLFPNPTLSANRWYSMVVTFDSLNFKTYVNGVLKSSYPWDGSPIGTSTMGLNIGSYWDLFVALAVTSPFKGFMDDIRLYNRVLADSEIAQYPLTVKDTAVAFAAPIHDTAYTGINMTANYIVSKSFRSTNSFTLQLSDLSGSFASPITVSSVTATGAGSITGNVLSSVPTGWHRMRIIASAPADTSLETDVYVKAPPPPFITIAASPSNTVPSTSSINFTATAGNTISNALYQWKKNSTPIAGANTNTFTANTGNTASGDTITAVVHITGSATSDSAVSNKVVITYTTGVANVLNVDNVELYPSPNDGIFTLNINGLQANELAVEISNIAGEIVYKDKINPSNGKATKQISLKDAPDGVYTISINGSGSRITKRFVISK